MRGWMDGWKWTWVHGSAGNRNTATMMMIHSNATKPLTRSQVDETTPNSKKARDKNTKLGRMWSEWGSSWILVISLERKSDEKRKKRKIWKACSQRRKKDDEEE